jgi:uncharacterized membrane protein
MDIKHFFFQNIEEVVGVFFIVIIVTLNFFRDFFIVIQLLCMAKKSDFLKSKSKTEKTTFSFA